MTENTHPFYKILFMLVACGLIVYGLFNTRFLINGPELVLAEINEEESIIKSDTNVFLLKGKVTHSVIISINDRPITIDEEGNFSERFLLSEEINIIQIRAQDKFGKETQRDLTVVYTNNGDNLASLSNIFEIETSQFDLQEILDENDEEIDENDDDETNEDVLED